MSAAALFFFSATVLMSGFAPFYWRGEHIEPERIQKYRGYKFDELREAVIDELRNHAVLEQADVISVLSHYESRQQIRNIRPLWICNVIRFEAEIDDVETLRESIPHGQILRVQYADAELFNPATVTFVPPTGDSLSWGLQRIGADKIWTEYGIDGAGVLVAILDSGVDFGAVDLADALWNNPGEIPFNGIDDDGNGYIDDWRGWDWTEDDPWPHDERGHGTHVSGTVGGRGFFGYGTGVAPGCVIMPLKILDNNGRGDETQVWEAIQYAMDMGARVMNLSIGWRYSSGPDRSSWRAAIDAACEAGVLMCIAAGNEGTTAGAPSNLRTPGDVPSAITIGATNFADELASFSSVGPVAWDTIPGFFDYPYPPGHIKPDITAPGDSIPSMIIGGGYAYWDGTSMATPHVAGAAALLIQLDPTLVHYDVKAILEASAADLGPAGKDSAFGSGLLDLPSAFARVSGFGWLAGNSVPGAKISATSYSAWVEANVSGDFVMKLTEGGHLIKADAFNFDADSAFITITAGETTFVDFSLISGMPYEIELVARDFDTGDPIGYVVFQFVDWPSESLISDADGKITATFAEKDPTLIRASKPGYIGDSRHVEPERSQKYFFYMHRAMDFEDDSLLSHWGPIDDWEWGTVTPGFGPNARSGTRLWGTDLDSSYSDTTDSWLGLGFIDLTEDSESPQLAYFQWFELEATSRACWDGGNVLARRPGGEWNIIEPVGGYPIFLDSFNPITGGQPGFSGEYNFKHWHEVRFDLSAWEGGEIELAVRMGSDNNTTRLGWFIDDVALLKRTLRGPIIRNARLSGTAMEIALECTIYAVSEAIDTSTIFAHITSPVIDSVRLFLETEFARATIDWFSVGDTIRAWFSARDISGRQTVFPHGAPDSTMFFIITDSFPVDTTSPKITPYGYWHTRFEGLDSLDIGFIIAEESPWEAVFRWGETVLADSIAFSGVANDTVLFRIRHTGSSMAQWSLLIADSSDNVSETPVMRTLFADGFLLDFYSTPHPAAQIESSGWNWHSDTGWSVSASDTALETLPLPLFAAIEPVRLVVYGHFHFGLSSGAVLRAISESWSSFLNGPSSISPMNPHFPGASGITMIGDSAVFDYLPHIIGEPHTIELTLACADTAYWRVDSIKFSASVGIEDVHLPEKPYLSVFPNPFNGKCKIEFGGEIFGIEIIDITGRLVREYSVTPRESYLIWDGRDDVGNSLSTGIYLIRSKGCEIVRKAVYIK